MIRNLYRALLIALIGIFGATVLTVDVALAKTKRHVIRSLDDFSPGKPPKIKLHFSLPKAGVEPFPAVVLMHGCDGRLGGSASWNALKSHAKYLNKLGFATVLVDSFSHRRVTVEESCLRGTYYGDLRAYDAAAALEFLQSQPNIKNDAIGIQGASQGGFVVLNSISEDSADYRREGDNNPGFAAGVAFYPWCAVLSPPARPVLILIGEKDDWSRASLCRVWTTEHQNRPHPPELVVYPKTHHSFDLSISLREFMGHTVGGNRKATRDAQKRLGEFFQRHLQ